jgi:hypothetical protein
LFWFYFASDLAQADGGKWNHIHVVHT